MKETIWCSIWKDSVQWDKMTGSQKLISIWFSLSFVGLGVECDSLLVALITVANIYASACCVVKYVPMEDD